MTKNELLKKLAPYHQEQLLVHWEKLTEVQQNHLVRQLTAIDFPLITTLYKNHHLLVDAALLTSPMKEPPAYLLEGEHNHIKKNDAFEVGKSALASGKMAVLIVAGGQGTRLGFDHPKGMYPIGCVNGTTLFQIHIEKIIARVRKYGKSIPLCVMTSPATHDETVAFLSNHRQFGLAEEDLYIFCQGTMPAVSMDSGEILLAAPDQLALSPGGHGGMLAAIDKSGILAKLEKRGVEQLFYFQVDNPLVDIGNEEFLGYHILSHSELSSQVVRKNDPKERVGNVVSIDGRLHVIEYSDLPDEFAQRRRVDGTLEIWAGSIAVHLMNLDFLKTQSKKPDSLPFHIAKKKVPFVNAQGELQNPAEPNAIKFERFIFDLLPSAKNAIVVEVDTFHHFAPLKNASGEPTDSPESVKKQCSDFYTEWLIQSGAKVASNVMVEVCPLYAHTKEEFSAKIKPGLVIDRNHYFQ